MCSSQTKPEPWDRTQGLEKSIARTSTTDLPDRAATGSRGHHSATAANAAHGQTLMEEVSESIPLAVFNGFSSFPSIFQLFSTMV